MKLPSSDGASVMLRPLAYQFPTIAKSSGAGYDWDANWLTIRCEVSTAAGQHWVFENPCLMTADALALAEWLDRVAAGDYAIDANKDPTVPDLCFTEPVIAFSVDGKYDNGHRLRLFLSLEGLPAWLPDRAQLSLYEWSMPLHVDHSSLAHAAGEWRHDCAGFPPR